MERSIIFDTETVCAILDGRKTVTRKLIKQYVPKDAEFGYTAFTPEGFISARGQYVNGWGEKFYRLPCVTGDILFVRETWSTTDLCDLFPPWPDHGETHYIYKADAKPGDPIVDKARWRPSTQMPREAARIFLRVTGVRVEQLQDITPEQIDAEGCKMYAYNEAGARQPSDPSLFKIRWNAKIKFPQLKLYGWDANPWVWVIEFERMI